jgi:hypothetical protein
VCVCVAATRAGEACSQAGTGAGRGQGPFDREDAAARGVAGADEQARGRAAVSAE